MKRLSILCETTDGFRIAEDRIWRSEVRENFRNKTVQILSFSCTDLTRDKDVLDQ
ncbi:MAG: hypothetical protein R3A12_07425 [Ignavibacteria bacterium]